LLNIHTAYLKFSTQHKGGFDLRKVHIDYAKSGEAMARPIWSANGTVLIGVGIILNERYIERLKGFGIDYIFVDDLNTADIFPEETIRDETRKTAVENVYKTMMELSKAPDVRRKVAVPGMGQAYHNIFAEILVDLTSKKDLLFNLANLHVRDGYLFNHSVNVAVLAGIVGIAKGYNRNQLLELGVGALLFDVGMTQFPNDVWQVNKVFTSEERERIQKHTEEGFEMLRKHFDISLLSAHCAFQHHERYDGSGYPRGLKGNEIHEYAQIVSIADVYCALTSPRAYRKAYSPNEAIEFLYANGNQWFDLDLIKIFCSHIAIYPVATTVLLNTGQIGVVSVVNSVASHRPIIRIIAEAGGQRVSQAYEIDLSREMNIMVVQEL
jgi:HD-GYP domain-containing protein (c-di-GMP phosphodiesterase class II)